MSSIIVTGVGEFSKSPDLITINFAITQKNMDYSALIASANAKFEGVKNILADCDFTAKDFKTSAYVVSPEYKYVDRGQVFDGYNINHSFFVCLKYDMQRLSEIISSLSSNKSDVNFSLQFSVKDGESVKNKCISLATADAKKKAELIAKDLGLKISGIVKVSYGESFHVKPSGTRMAPFMANCDMSAIDILPQNAVARETITIEFCVE